MSVKYIRPEVRKLLPVYQMIRDVLAGPKAVKDAGTRYLPEPDPSDRSPAAKKRYENYLARAQFFDATSRTHEGLIGQMFYRETQIELPALLEVMRVDVDGTGISLEQQAKEAAENVLACGRAGLYTDYSLQGEKVVTRREQESGKVRATIKLYRPEQIINWRWHTIGNHKYLSLVVLEEEFDIEDDGFETSQGIQWRELRMVTPTDEEGNPTGAAPILMCNIWQETDNNGKSALEIVSTTYPRKGNGQPWDRIPFEFIGVKNNDPIPDRPPMEGMAHVNIGHYRNSADYEESVFMLGQPTPWASGLTEDWVEEVWDGELRLGSREVVPLPQGGTMGLLQPAPNTLAKEAMDQKERQLVALGAKLVEQKQVQRTATEAGADKVVEDSVLSSVAKNVTSAYQKALEHALVYSNLTEEVVFEINTDFEITRMSPQDRAQLLAEWQSGAITWEEYRWNMKRSGVAYQDDEEARRQVQADMIDTLDLDDEEEEETE